MSQIRISPRASSDLTEIWSYIADDSVANADAFIDKVNQTIQVLANQLGSGRRREELAPGIVRVLHGARDIQTIFEG